MRRFVLISAAISLAGAAVLSAQNPVPLAARGQGPQVVARAIRMSLRGIDLTDPEKGRLASVHTRHAAQFKALADSTKPAMAALRAARAEHDTAGARAARRALVALRRSGIARTRTTLLDVRAALTPEHQTTFDRNAVRVRVMLRRLPRR